MNNKLFYRIFLSLLAVALILTVVHAVYILYAYQHASIIYFIGKELW